MLERACVNVNASACLTVLAKKCLHISGDAIFASVIHAIKNETANKGDNNGNIM